MTFRTLIDISGRQVNVVDDSDVRRRSAEQNASSQAALANKAMSRVQELNVEADKWKLYNNWRRESFRRFLEIAEVEHARGQGHKRTAERLFNESVEAPRPEERPFANTPGLVQQFREGVVEEVLREKPMAALAGTIQEEEAKRLGVKLS